MVPVSRAPDLDQVFKAYDVRGTVPDQVDPELARATARRVRRRHRRRRASWSATTCGRARPTSSPRSPTAPRPPGADVVLIGLAATDQLYFASGHLDVPGAMFTASHNPAHYNGIKLCHAGARPVGRDTGLTEIRDRVARGAAYDRRRGRGEVTELDVLGDYAAHLLVAGAGRRRGGCGSSSTPATAWPATPRPAVFERLTDVELVPMYFELDGTFPHHEANPIEPGNLVDLQRRVRRGGRRRGARLRRRRRPLLPGRRAGRRRSRRRR